MSRPSASETTPSTPRGILDTLRESTAIKVTALGLSALTLVGCGKSGPEGWPENPCSVAEEAVPVSQEDGTSKGWICPVGTRNDGITNEQAAGGQAANPANIPTVIDTPTTVATPTSNPETLNETQQIEAAMTAEQLSHTYYIDGEAMTYDQLVKHFTIPANETDHVKVANKIVTTLNEVANAGNTVEEYLANKTEFDKDPTNPANMAKKPETVHGYYSNAVAEALFVGNIDTESGLGTILNADTLAAYTAEFVSTGKSENPFKVTYELDNIRGSYKQYEVGDPYANSDAMGITAEVTVSRTGSLEMDSTVQNGVDKGIATITLVAVDGRWVINGAGVVWQ